MPSTDIVIVGGGIVGISTAYFLATAGIKSLVIEKDSIASHASGFAYGDLYPLENALMAESIFAVASDSMDIHKYLATELPERTGVNTEYRVRPTASLCFTEDEVSSAKISLEYWQKAQNNYEMEWLDPKDIRSLDSRISHDVLGATYVQNTAEVEPYRFVLALAQAAEEMGVAIRHGKVTGLKQDAGKVTGVLLENDQINCSQVVLAMGPWSGNISSWHNIPIPIKPLKGQILRLRAPGPPFHCSIGWSGSYAITKTDGLLWTGTTEEHVGFDETPTDEARDQIMASLLKVIPSMIDAQLVQQTACLRPLSEDGNLVIGQLPGLEGAYIATGGARDGILLGPSMGRLTSLLVRGQIPDISVQAFDPVRF